MALMTLPPAKPVKRVTFSSRYIFQPHGNFQRQSPKFYKPISLLSMVVPGPMWVWWVSRVGLGALLLNTENTLLKKLLLFSAEY